MYYPHHQASQQPGGSTAKHHEGPNVGGVGAGGGWGRFPLPNPAVYPGLGYPPPPPPHHLAQQHHHPSFGNGGAGMHIPQQPTGGMGYGGMGMYGGAQPTGQVGGSPPRQGVEPAPPLTAFWQHQMLRAEASRNSNAPHQHARTAAMASRMSNKVTISDPSSSNAVRTATPADPLGKKTALSTISHPDGAVTSPPSEASESVPNNIDPATPAEAPAPTSKENDAPSEPWAGLDLGGIKLRTLSTALFAFSHITSLYINHNSLSDLPPAISNLRHLTLLDATANDLHSIPPELGVLCKLKELLLFDNQLTTLPPELGTLYNLETLGIDGNPLEERMRKVLTEEGTTALIVQLRDSCPVGSAPPERQWIEIEPDVSSPSSGKQESFTVLTYNILCAQFAPGMTYRYTPSWALDWSYRKQTILQEIINASADVVCMQELDGQQYAEYFHPQLKQHGYEGSHYPRSRARTMSEVEAKMVDGCATFWKEDRFQLVETQVVDFNQVAMGNIDMRTDDMFNRVMSRDNIAVVAALEFVASGARLVVANSHIYWDHRYRDVKLVQIGMLMEELEKIAERFAHLPARLTSDPEFNHGRGPPVYDRNEKGRDIPLILCVDLNSFLGSAVYDFLSTGEIPPDHEDFMSHAYGPYTAKGLRHHLGLRSACASFGEMKMTNFTPAFVAAIDYIFYSHRPLKVTSVLGDVDKRYLDRSVGFPNAHFPSDHIPVFAQFRVKGNSEPPSHHQVNHGYSH